MLKRFFPLILSSLLLALALPCNAQNKLNNPFLPSPANVGQTVAVNIPTLPQPVSERLACYSLSYARAKDVQEALMPHFGTKLGLDTITNSLILLGDEQRHARLRQLLPKLDVATKQVTLEAKIIAVSREDSKNLGVRWDWDTIPQRKQETNDSNSDSSNYDGSFKFWRGFAFRFNATLNALISNGKARILATPRIITIPGKEVLSVTTSLCRQKSMTVAAATRQQNIWTPASSCNTRLSSAKTAKWLPPVSTLR